MIFGQDLRRSASMPEKERKREREREKEIYLSSFREMVVVMMIEMIMM
jgi:hypothetical protein